MLVIETTSLTEYIHTLEYSPIKLKQSNHLNFEMLSYDALNKECFLRKTTFFLWLYRSFCSDPAFQKRYLTFDFFHSHYCCEPSILLKIHYVSRNDASLRSALFFVNLGKVLLIDLNPSLRSVNQHWIHF